MNSKIQCSGNFDFKALTFAFSAFLSWAGVRSKSALCIFNSFYFGIAFVLFTFGLVIFTITNVLKKVAKVKLLLLTIITMKTAQTTVNDRVRTLLKTLKLSPQEAAFRAGKHPNIVTRIVENESNPTHATIKLLAEAWGANPDWIWTGTGEMMAVSKSSAEATVNPYKDALISELKDQVTYLQEMLRIALGGKPGAQASNFKWPLTGTSSRVLRLFPELLRETA